MAHSQQVELSRRERLIEAARELFYVHGYEGTSVAEILERAGVNSGSMYHYFGGKEDLLIAVLETYKDLLKPVLIEPILARELDPLERIFALLDGYRRGVIHSMFTQGCPIGNLGLEVGDHIPQARRLVAENFSGWCGWMETWLEEAKGRLPADLDRKQLAMFILTVMEGGIMQARAHGNIEPFDACVRQLRDHLAFLQDKRRNEGV